MEARAQQRLERKKALDEKKRKAEEEKLVCEHPPLLFFFFLRNVFAYFIFSAGGYTREHFQRILLICLPRMVKFNVFCLVPKFPSVTLFQADIAFVFICLLTAW